MEERESKSPNWSKYYEEHKKIWYDPNVPLSVKGVLRLVELHRSDDKGWSISVRKFAKLLGIAKNTALEAINYALRRGYLETNKKTQRKRRKLRLSVLLRVPVDYESYEDNPKLDQWEVQAGLPESTGTGSPTETLNSNGNNNLNIFPQAEEKEKKEKKSYKKEHPSYSELRRIAESLRQGGVK